MNNENHYADSNSRTEEWFITHTLCGHLLDQPLNDRNLVVPGYHKEKEVTCEACILIAFAEPARVFDQEERLFRDVIVRHYYNYTKIYPLKQIE